VYNNAFTVNFDSLDLHWYVLISTAVNWYNQKLSKIDVNDGKHQRADLNHKFPSSGIIRGSRITFSVVCLFVKTLTISWW